MAMAQSVQPETTLPGSETSSSTSSSSSRHRTEPSLLSSYHDKDKLDLVIVVDGTCNYLEKYFRVLCDHHKHIFKRLRKRTKRLRVSLVVFKDVGDLSSPGQSHRHTEKQPPVTFDTCISNFVSSLEELSEIFKTFDKDVKEIYSRAVTRKGNTGGLADALFKVSNLTFRRNANKICIILAPSLHSTAGNASGDDPSLFVSPHGHDAVKLSRFLASKGIVLSILGCVPSGIHLVMNKVAAGVDYNKLHVPQVAHVNPNVFTQNVGLHDSTDILEALSLITGGQYIPIFSTSSLTELIICVIEEDLSAEDAVGLINDHIILEVFQQFGDVNVYHLTRTLCNYLNDPERKCTAFGHLLLNESPAASLCDFAERLSWASCLEEMREISKGQLHKPHPILSIASVRITRDGDITEKEGMRMVRRLIARMGHSV